jgi:hypothetical protein
MPITWEETRDSPKINGTSIERRYAGWGTSDKWAARTALLAEAPLLDGYLVRQDGDVQLEPLDGHTEIWSGTVTYSPPSDSDDASLLPPTFKFSTSGGKAKMTSSYQVTGAWGAAGETVAVDDYGGLIGAKDDGSVEGVEVEVPGFTWQETWYPPLENLTWAYALKVRNLSACTNKQKFRAFLPGEVLFLYCEGGKKDEETGELTFHFASNPNVRGLTVGAITGIDKRGWEYLEIKSRPHTIEGPPKRTVVRPYAAYTHRVFNEGFFSALGIG